MKKKNCIFRFIILSLLYLSLCFVLYAEEDSGFWFVGDLVAAPFTYGTLFPMNSINLSFSGLLGFTKGRYIHAFEVVSDQFFLSSRDPDNPYEGNRYNTSLIIDSFSHLSPYIRLKWGSGGFWIRDSFSDDTSEWEINDFFGLTFLSALKFSFPWPYLDLEITNKIDLIYAFDAGFTLLFMDPGYTGSLRINIHPGKDWLTIYLKASVLYWSYSGEINRINTLLLQPAAGFSLDTEKIRQKPVQPLAADPLPEVKLTNQSETGDQELKKVAAAYPELAALWTGEAGTKIEAGEIAFENATAVLLPVSYPLLDAIVTVMQQSSQLIISLAAYSEFHGDPQMDYNLYLARTNKVRDYIIENQIDNHRVVMSKKGRILVPGNQKKGSIILEILKN